MFSILYKNFCLIVYKSKAESEFFTRNCIGYFATFQSGTVITCLKSQYKQQCFFTILQYCILACNIVFYTCHCKLPCVLCPSFTNQGVYLKQVKLYGAVFSHYPSFFLYSIYDHFTKHINDSIFSLIMHNVNMYPYALITSHSIKIVRPHFRFHRNYFGIDIHPFTPPHPHPHLCTCLDMKLKTITSNTFHANKKYTNRIEGLLYKCKQFNTIFSLDIIMQSAISRVFFWS